MPQTDLVEMKVCLIAHGPLLLGSGLPIGNVRSSEEFVAGSVWRGAVARVILERLGKRNYDGRSNPDPTVPADFTTVFGGRSPARFGFLYPVVGWQEMPLAHVTAPLPLTAHTCKRYPGFNKPRGHGVYDSLLNRLCHDENPEFVGTALKQCPECDERLERIRGYISTLPATIVYRQEKLGTRSLVRVGINRYTETAQDQMLFVQDVLDPAHDDAGMPKPLAFVGRWRGSAQQAALLQELLKTYALPTSQGGFHLHIGSARSRGLGSVELQMSAPHQLLATQQAANVAERVDRVTDLVSSGSGQRNYSYATLTLRTPLQMWDEQGVPTTQLTEALLRAYQPIMPSALYILHKASLLEQEQCSGWSAAWGLPKPVAPVLAAGSVFVVRVPQHQRQPFLDFLTAIEQDGLGERRAEGWGEVSICDPFHVVHDERNTQTKERGSDNQ